MLLINDYDTAFDYSNLCKYYIDETINYDEGDNTDEVSEDIATENVCTYSVQP